MRGAQGLNDIYIYIYIYIYISHSTYTYESLRSAISNRKAIYDTFEMRFIKTASKVNPFAAV